MQRQIAFERNNPALLRRTSATPEDVLRQDAVKTKKKADRARERLISGLARVLATYRAEVGVIALGDGQSPDIARLRAAITADDSRIARAATCALVNRWLHGK